MPGPWRNHVRAVKPQSYSLIHSISAWAGCLIPTLNQLDCRFSFISGAISTALKSGSPSTNAGSPPQWFFKVGSCIQKTKTGKLDHRRSISLIHELSANIQFHNDQNILVDLRNAEIRSDMQNLMMFAGECANNKSGFDKKIAILIPNTAKRIETAKRFKSCLDMLGFRLRQFFGHQAAIEWLSVEE